MTTNCHTALVTFSPPVARLGLFAKLCLLLICTAAG
jgi:hypothetical protein